MQFNNPIVGQEDLIREGIKSPNFSSDPETGVQGWRIARDGSATFYNLTVGSPNFTIDENGNAVFETVTANQILLDGEDLETILMNIPRGMLAMTTLPTSTGAYDGSNDLIIARHAIPEWDPERQYKVSIIGRIDKQSSTPTYVLIRCRYAWNAIPTRSSSVLYEYQLGTGVGNGNDEMFSIAFAFNNQSQSPGDTINLVWTVSANASGLRYQGSSWGRCWSEDIGTAADYSAYDPGTDQPPTQQYVKEYSANGSASHQSDGTNRNVSELYQGYYSSTNGNQFSVITFPISTIQSDLAGSTINKVELYLNNNHWYNNSGGTAVIGTHPYTSPAGDSNYSDLNPDLDRHSFSYGQAKWVTLPNSIGNALRDNTAKGICLGKGPSTSHTYYGYFAGNGQSGEPKLRITYTK